MLAMARKKDNGKIECASEEKCIKRVFFDNQHDRTRDELLAITKIYPDLEWRLYETVNYRDTKKAWILMQRKMLGWMEQEEGFDWTKRIGSLWKSSLMKPEARHSGDMQTILDLDEKEKTEEFREFLRINVIDVVEEYSTPNGHHFIVKSFDRRMLDNTGFEGKVEILKDGLKVVQ